MSTLLDPEFGKVSLRRSRLAKNVRLKLDARGVISISLPTRTPLFMAKRLLDGSRHNLRKLLADITKSRRSYNDGDVVGKSHRLRFEQGDIYKHRLYQTDLIVTHPPNPEQTKLDHIIHQAVSKALRVQAQAYLPRRVDQLAGAYDFTYQKLRFSSAGTRWGSCSSQGTISLNIWLMQLPFELIDYVIIHELCHTKHMNHSPTFWQLVATYCPDHATKRKILRAHRPSQ
jgi:hypothetical protein